MGASGGEPYTLEFDLVAAEAPTQLDDFLSANGLVCDVLVNSAGYGLRGAATALPIVEQLGIIDLNIRALTELSLHFLPGMVARKRGGMLNLSSVAGFMPGPYMALYYASKGFVRLFSEALYQEFRHTGVTVTCVAPGWVRRSSSKGPGSTQTALPVFAQAGSGGCRRTRVARVQIRSSPGRAGLFGQVGRPCGCPLPSAAMLALIGRLQRSGNDPCTCGSGMKYKKCCGARTVRLRGHLDVSP